MKIGAARDYELGIGQGTSPTGEQGVLMRISSLEDDHMVFLFLGKDEIDELICLLQANRFKLMEEE